MSRSFLKNKRDPATTKENSLEEKAINTLKIVAFIFIQQYWRRHVSHQGEGLEEKKCTLAAGKDKVPT